MTNPDSSFDTVRYLSFGTQHSTLDAPRPPLSASPPDLLCVGSGHPLVLIGGLHSHFEFQRSIADALARNFRVYCFSLPGEDAPASAPVLVEETARRLLVQISAAGLQQFHLCGISMGGLIALEMALQVPEFVDRLAICLSFAEYTFLHPQAKRLFDCLVRWRREVACRGISRSTFLAMTLRELAVEAPSPVIAWSYWMRFLRFRSSRHLVWTRLKMIRRASLLDRLPELKIPVLLMAAERDRLVHPLHSVQMAQRLPHARFVLVEGSGHLFPFLRPGKFAEILTEFLKEELPEDRK